MHFAFQQAEGGTTVGEVCRKMGIAEATFYRWKQLYGGLMPSEVKKLRQLEEENARLRKGGRRSDARQGNAAGGYPPQTMTPARGRELIDFVREAFRVSIREHAELFRHRARHTITDPADPSRRP